MKNVRFRPAATETVRRVFRDLHGWCAFVVAVGAAFQTVFADAPLSSKSNGTASFSGNFCANSPFDSAIAKLLGISTNGLKEVCEIIDWKLQLHRGADGTPLRYELRCDYGVTVPNTPGLGRSLGSVRREGACTISEGTKSKPNAIVYNLALSPTNDLSLLRLSPNVLHILDTDGSLLVGNGGWSYTLNASDYSEKAVEPALAATVPDMSYQISSIASGQTVFGVFEGRSPCQGIAQELQIPVPASATKAKWRVTLYKDPATGAPSTYKIEGTLFRSRAREGTWTALRGTRADLHDTVIRLGSTTEPAITFLRGDENVLFFLDETGNPRVGHCEFSYTLNRRVPPAAPRP